MPQHTLNPERRADKWIIWPFVLQVISLAFLPFIVWWSFTPANILNSSPAWELLETLGMKGGAAVFFASVPIGVIGLRMLRRMKKLRRVTRILAILNIVCGAMEWGMLVLMFCAVVFGGVSV